MLTLRRGDYLLNYAETVDEMLPQSHRINLQHTAIAELPDVPIISRCQTPEAEQLMARLNQAARQLRANGEMARLLRLPPGPGSRRLTGITVDAADSPGNCTLRLPCHSLISSR